MIERKGCSLEQFQRAMDISRSTLFNWFKREKCPPGKDHKKALADFFGEENIEYLLSGDPGSSERESKNESKNVIVRNSNLEREILDMIHRVIGAAANDPGRLYWIREQLRLHLDPPIHWTKNLTDQEIIAGSYEIEKDLREADERRRHGQSVG